MIDPDRHQPTETLDGAALQALLPHRYPLLLVDRIDVIEPGRRVVGRKRIAASEWWTGSEQHRGAAFPFSLVIEALAQTSGALARDLADGAEGAIAYFMGVNRVRMRQPAYPGDELVLQVTLLQWRRGVCRTQGIATVDGRLVTTAELTTVVRGVA